MEVSSKISDSHIEDPIKKRGKLLNSHSCVLYKEPNMRLVAFVEIQITVQMVECIMVKILVREGGGGWRWWKSTSDNTDMLSMEEVVCGHKGGSVKGGQCKGGSVKGGQCKGGSVKGGQCSQPSVL